MSRNDRIRLLVLFGGASEEHDVSVKSARELSRHIDPKKYDVCYVRVGRDGSWRHTASPDSPDSPKDPAALPIMGGHPGGIIVTRDGGYHTIHIDAAFPMIHGKYGEDGVIQGILGGMGIPYAGCGIASSILCFDKALTYQAVSAAGVAAPKHMAADYRDRDSIYRFISERGYPAFVKPARSGSSFGVTKVTGAGMTDDAIREAARYDSKILIEEAISGREIGCAVMGNGKELTFGELDEVALSGGFFRIHQESAPEMGSENASFIAPAPVREALKRRILDTAAAIYTALGCRGLARVDMFVTPDERIILNEVNTMPGFTSYSRYPRMMMAAGWTPRDVIDRLIALAIDDVVKT